MKRPKTETRNGVGRRALLLAASAAGMVGSLAQSARADQQSISIGYIRSMERHPTISLLDREARNDGLAGAQMGLDDNNTTGRFMGQEFVLVDKRVRGDADPVAALTDLTGQGISLVLTDLPAPAVLKLADAGAAKGVTIFNIAAPDDSLRGADCRGNLIHVAPSRDMLADALAQYLAWKRWNRWLLMYGSHPSDTLLADAYRRAAKRFGARIVQEREYKDRGGSRETDSGLVQTQQQMPVFTQNAPEYDVLVAADENEVFAGYLPYRTWDPRPVAGSAGLRPTSWDPSTESWGATQMQDRFLRTFHRTMTPLDMQAWTAVRMVGEAASRTHSADPKAIMAYMKGPKFEVAAYKGEALSLRDWDWQVRQPILLSDGRNVVSVSPQPGFLHQTTDLDTLGVDRPETTCKLR
ncbi:MAG TPA: ABC transporter substrate-binding protein [Acetobacteraceae bacterium]|nr:ABC transporter substrate-binding protein [Acetobacteraceae bacterium]